VTTIVRAGRLVALARPDTHYYGLAAGWINDPRVNRTLVTGTPWPVSELDIGHWLPLGDPPSAFLIVPVGPGHAEPVGLTHFHSYDRKARSIKLAILIEPGSQGCGYGTEAVRLMLDHAFTTFDLNRVALSAFASNPGGLRAYERAGFVREGTRRHAWYRDGRWHDDVLMAVLRGEWERMGR
jgi:RimJ/RimL family protein N-acetyltransferase